MTERRLTLDSTHPHAILPRYGHPPQVHSVVVVYLIVKSASVRLLSASAGAGGMAHRTSSTLQSPSEQCDTAHAVLRPPPFFQRELHRDKQLHFLQCFAWWPHDEIRWKSGAHLSILHTPSRPAPLRPVRPLLALSAMSTHGQGGIDEVAGVLPQAQPAPVLTLRQLGRPVANVAPAHPVWGSTELSGRCLESPAMAFLASERGGDFQPSSRTPPASGPCLGECSGVPVRSSPGTGETGPGQAFRGRPRPWER